MKKFKFITLLFMLALISLTASSKKLSTSLNIQDSLEIKIDTMIARMGFSSQTPGGVVGVIKDGRIIFKKAYGLADFDTKEPNNTSTLFNLGSVSKQFTAAAILLLSKENKLSLKDDIRKYLPDFPDYGYKITIENLIHHTSGIKSFDVLMLMAGTLFTKETPEESYKLIIKQKSLNYKPGEEYLYSNSGYVLLAKIIENVSGMKFSQFIEEKLFRPIGMDQTLIYDNMGQVIKNSASGHTWGGDEKFKKTQEMNNTDVGITNQYTCLEDFLKWDNNFYNNKLGKWDFSREMTSRVTLNGGDTCLYGFGLEISDYHGLKTVEHQGGTGDFTAQYFQVPSEKFAVVCLFNIPTDVTGLAYKITDLFIKGTPVSVTAAVKPEITKVDSSVLLRYVGKYFDEIHGFGGAVTREGDHLIFDAAYQGRLELLPLTDTSFLVTVADLKFIFSQNGKGETSKVTILQGKQKFVLAYLGTDVFPLKPEQLTQFAGEFYCNEINVTYPILLKDNKLYVRFPESTAKFCNTSVESELISDHTDYFASPVGGIEFTRMADNISGFVIKDVGRARNLVFNKVKL